MRLRNVKGAREKISASVSVIDDPKEYKGKWSELFGNDNPIYIEIGMGKGKFIIDNAIKKGEIEPNGCGECNICRQSKKLTGVFSYKKLFRINEEEK